MSWREPAAVSVAIFLGWACAKLGVPAPAPPSLFGVLLIAAVTGGYALGR